MEILRYRQSLKTFLEDVEVKGKIQKRFKFVESESSKEIHIKTFKSDYKLLEATSDEVEMLNGTMDKFDADHLSFIGHVEYEKNYLINESWILLQKSGVAFTSRISLC